MTDERMKDRLARQLTLSDAVILGISAMIGSGIFVAIGPAAGAAGSGILLGIILAAFVAFCNATSSAQLAALYPESGGTYVYGQKQLGPFWGWLAGLLFIIGKIASCAAAALTFGYYVAPSFAKYLALAAVLCFTVLNIFGIKKSARMTRVLTLVVLSVLAMVFVAALFGETVEPANLNIFINIFSIPGILQSAALMFFAFAGYARIATLGEEVQDPRKNIPTAIVTSLVLTALIYLSVTLAVLLAIGPKHLSLSAAPLVEALNAGKFASLSPIVKFGAAAATLGVLLSLILGVSRTAFAMAANRDLPSWLSVVHPRYKVPQYAEIVVGVVVALVVVFGDVLSAVGFSAFTILVYYAITNACVISLAKEKLLWPRALAFIGLLSCFVLAFSLPLAAIIKGSATIAGGVLIYFLQAFIKYLKNSHKE
ncbi:MAG: amino acid permease [Candidatus Omnitrophica bacterium]|nr:amino acid permease [Candidatus Omnitrophota bacterium]